MGEVGVHWVGSCGRCPTLKLLQITVLKNIPKGVMFVVGDLEVVNKQKRR